MTSPPKNSGRKKVVKAWIVVDKHGNFDNFSVRFSKASAYQWAKMSKEHGDSGIYPTLATITYIIPTPLQKK